MREDVMLSEDDEKAYGTHSSPHTRARDAMGIRPGCEVDLTGKVAVVTGANTGIGMQTAKMLADAGAEVIMACRSIERAKTAKARASNGGKNAVSVMTLDLSDTDSVRKFAANFSKKYAKLDILVNNAGLNASSGYQGPKTTSQGYDICMGVNYLGHFMLTSLLLPLLMKSVDGARVVALSSVTTWFGSNKYHYYYKGASKTKGNYGSSKLACLAMTVEMQRRLDAKYPKNKIMCVAADPGFVASDIWRDFNPVVRKIMGILALSPAQGAMTSVNAASLASIKKAQLYMPFSIKMSKLFKMNRSAAYTFGMPLLSKIFAGFSADTMAPRAKNTETNAKLWDLSVEFCKENGVEECEAYNL